MKKTALLLTLLLGGCLTLSGNYELRAETADGRPLAQNIRMLAQGSGIYTTRNGMCGALAKQNAVIRIYHLESGEELSSESPYRCRN
ncbi:MAG: hypothetical protein Q4D82_03305 [Neisseria sp.]|nr:hypothetical protein [Neisseria sp.]